MQRAMEKKGYYTDNYINRIKYYLAVKKCGRDCFEKVFYMLYYTWSRGRNYTTLQEFCVECLGVQKGYLTEHLCQPEIVFPQISASSSTALVGIVHESEQQVGNEARHSSCDASNFHSVLFEHVISPGRRSVRRSHNEVTGKLQDATDATDTQRRQPLWEKQDLRSSHISEGQMQHDTQLIDTEASSCVGQNAVLVDYTCAEKPKGVNSSHLWERMRRLFLPKALGKNNVNLDCMPLRQGIFSVTSPPLPPSPPSPFSPTTKRSVKEEKVKFQASCEDMKSFKDKSQDLNQVVQEAQYKMQSEFVISYPEKMGCFLHAEPDPSRLPLSVLLSLLTNIFPEVSPKIRILVYRLHRLLYVVCYEDVLFHDPQLQFWLQKLSTVISELVAAVVRYCTVLIKRFIVEASEKLKASKQRLQETQTEYKKYLLFVEKTREKFEIVEKKLKEAQIENSWALRVCTHSCSHESDDTLTTNSKEKRNSYNCAARNTEIDSMNRTASCNLALTEDLEEEVWMKLKNDDDIPVSDSLLVSVMREVALIEKKHNTYMSYDRKLKMMVRNAHKSVIVTKREMRDGLNSDVSAEENAISKEVLSRRQMKTRKLSKEVKKLRQNKRDLQSDQKAFMSRIDHDLETLVEKELDEAALLRGQYSVEHLQRESGLLLRELRREAKGFASRARIEDLGDWLMKQRYTTTSVRQLYSYVRVADTRNSFLITDLVGTGPLYYPVIVLSGPKGSGKTCMFHYLLHQWKDNLEAVKSNIHEFDLVIYGKMSSVLSSGSWAQYLREHVFSLTLVDFPETRVFEALEALSVLSLLDMDISTASVTNILDEIFCNMGHNKYVVVATRLDSENDIVAAAKRHNIKCQRVKMCPMTSSAIQKFSTSLVSLIEEDEAVIKNKAKRFSRIVNSMAASEEVLYPLFITHLLYLWCASPCHALEATTVSRLVRHVIMIAESILVEALKPVGQSERELARAKAKRCTEQLCEAAWSLLSRQEWPYDCHFSLDFKSISLPDSVGTTSYRTLIMVMESADSKQRTSFLHPSIVEILSGFFLTQQRLIYRGTPILRRREKLEKYCVPEIRRYREVFVHMAGALVYTKHKIEDAKEIVALFHRSLADKRDMVAWRCLLRECDFLSNMCAAVSSVLSSYSSWIVANYSQETNCALADLLKREAYRPQTVIISDEGEFDCKSGCVIRALATCSSTLVHIRQELQFYAWGEPATCDALIVPLQPPGTLQECWGHVGVEGALALRHCHQLKELNVRVSSLESLNALTYSMKHIARGLRHLYLRLDLPTSTPLSDIEPLNFKGRSLWLRVKGVADVNLDWVKQVAMKLNTWYTDVLLEESSLSPSALQELKEFLSNTPVHISY